MMSMVVGAEVQNTYMGCSFPSCRFLVRADGLLPNPLLPGVHLEDRLEPRSRAGTSVGAPGGGECVCVHAVIPGQARTLSRVRMVSPWAAGCTVTCEEASDVRVRAKGNLCPLNMELISPLPSRRSQRVS